MHIRYRSIFLSIVLLISAAGCTTARVDDRMAYWRAETERFLPVGATMQQANEFFHSHGLELTCCVSGPQLDHAHMALERKAGRLLWTEYDVAILVDFSASQKVENVRIQRWGVGL